MEISDRFRGFLPVVLDVETTGVDPLRHGLLELCIVLPQWTDNTLSIGDIHFWSIQPHPQVAIDAASLQVTGIDLQNRVDATIDEENAIRQCFRMVRDAAKAHNCERAILTGHNAHFDHAFLKAAAERNAVGRYPFHKFSVLDTVSLSAVLLGQTVLKLACEQAGLAFDQTQAHGARYDALATAALFCEMVNRGIYAPSAVAS